MCIEESACQSARLAVGLTSQFRGASAHASSTLRSPRVVCKVIDCDIRRAWDQKGADIWNSGHRMRVQRANPPSRQNPQARRCESSPVRIGDCLIAEAKCQMGLSRRRRLELGLASGPGGPKNGSEESTRGPPAVRRAEALMHPPQVCTQATKLQLFALLWALPSSHFRVKPTHSLHTTTDKLSRHAYTLPSSCPMGGGSYYDAVDTIATTGSKYYQESNVSSAARNFKLRLLVEVVFEVFEEWMTSFTSCTNIVVGIVGDSPPPGHWHCDEQRLARLHVELTSEASPAGGPPGLTSRSIIALLCFHRISK
jgi:hypothetical protein